MQPTIGKKILYPLIFLTIISLVAISIITSTYGLDQIIATMQSYPILLLVAAFFLYTCRWIAESFAFKISTGKYHQLTFLQCFKTVIMTQFMNMITPFLSGGQPATLFILNRFGMDIASSFSAMFIKSMMYQFFLSIFGFVALLSVFGELDVLSRNAAVVGIFINMLIVFGILIIGISKSAAKKMIGFFIIAMKKIKLIRISNDTESSIYEHIENFNSSFREFRHERKRLLYLFLVTGIQFTLYNLCAYVILNGFGSFLNGAYFARVVLINTSALIVPTPGNSGGAEGLYAIFLSSSLPDGMIGAGILMWRLLVFYIPVIITGLLTFFITVNLLKDTKTKINKEVSM